MEIQWTFTVGQHTWHASNADRIKQSVMHVLLRCGLFHQRPELSEIYDGNFVASDVWQRFQLSVYGHRRPTTVHQIVIRKQRDTGGKKTLYTVMEAIGFLSKIAKCAVLVARGQSEISTQSDSLLEQEVANCQNQMGSKENPNSIFYHGVTTKPTPWTRDCSVNSCSGWYPW